MHSIHGTPRRTRGFLLYKKERPSLAVLQIADKPRRIFWSSWVFFYAYVIPNFVFVIKSKN